MKAWMHLKKPYLFTGSWLEGVRNLEELHELLKDVNPPEAVLRCFNVMCPYDKKLPAVSAEERGRADLVENFFGA